MVLANNAPLMSPLRAPLTVTHSEIQIETLYCTSQLNDLRSFARIFSEVWYGCLLVFVFLVIRSITFSYCFFKRCLNSATAVMYFEHSYSWQSQDSVLIHHVSVSWGHLKSGIHLLRWFFFFFGLFWGLLGLQRSDLWSLRSLDFFLWCLGSLRYLKSFSSFRSLWTFLCLIFCDLWGLWGFLGIWGP